MYSYYSVTAYGIRPPKLLSMCVTVLQTSQMLIGVVISVFVLILKLKNAVSATFIFLSAILFFSWLLNILHISLSKKDGYICPMVRMTWNNVKNSTVFEG